MVGCPPGSEEHNDGLAIVGYVDDFLGFDGDVVEGLEHLITPVADPSGAVKGSSNREVRRFLISMRSSQRLSGGIPVLLKPSHQRRTISTFSCDIARYVSRSTNRNRCMVKVVSRTN
jgi:hypothetical protein